MNYFEGPFSQVDDMDGEEIIKSSLVATVAIPIPHGIKNDEFGLCFEGYFDAPDTGVYSFYLSSDDGSTLEIGNTLIVDNDGLHSAIEVSGQIALQKGKPPIRIKYFERSGGELLDFQYHLKGKEEEKSPVPPSIPGIGNECAGFLLERVVF